MSSKSIFLVIAALLAAICLAAPQGAEASRLGGGRSFGGGSGYSRPVPSPSRGFSQPSSPGGMSPGGQGQSMPMRRGMSPFGGMFYGGLLGSMFFGHPFGGVGVFDILIIGMLIWVVVRFLGSRGRRGPTDRHYGNNSHGGMESDDFESGQGYGRDARYRAAEQAWDALRSPSERRGPELGQQADVAEGVHLPAGFDADEFMKGAKIVFARLQESWSGRDLDDIREFTTPNMYGEIERQAKDDPTPAPTDVLVINARLMEVKQQGRATSATVYYEVTMRENRAMATTEQVREVWTFVRDEADPKAMWKLDGIQQIEK
ncbi:import inner membrane translocase subunit Tim44 [Desulfovibrio sp. X2]|uniref:Tim44 domain-containing protein n=1 Tax=Desulfovibrio sp. X2 TaxID=941449 RepID=UPI00035889A6|nr:TIM44-like domain-containing protein [Desulfovibrio sp. X2]EPR42679.1 import inner membrane translocase subunit Tim44 [Desulfovibrio sp. X2]